jgi:hypothetical protein
VVRPGNKLSATLCWLSKPITDRSPGIRSRHPLPNRLSNNPVKEHGRPQIALSTTPSPFGREVSRVLIKRPTRSGAAPPGVGCVVRHSGTVHQQPGHFAQGPTRTRRYEAACAQAIGTLRAIGWVWQGSQHASVTTRNGAIGDEHAQHHTPADRLGSCLECHTPPGAAAVYAIAAAARRTHATCLPQASRDLVRSSST